MTQAKPVFKTFLKIAFAAGIIYWLLSKGKLDLSLVKKAFIRPELVVITFSLLILQCILAAWRWKKLLEVKAKSPLPLFTIIKLTWIGLFFSSVLPGAVTGDFIKVIYARHLDSNLNKTFLVMSVLMDRIIGLIGLLFLLGAFSVYSFTEITSISSHLNTLIHFNFLLFIGVIFFFVSIFLPKKVQQILLPKFGSLPLIGPKVQKTLEQVWIIGESKKTVWTCLGVSLCTQFLGILAFWSISSQFYETPIPLHHVFTFMPVGLMAVAVPISPAGLGVGHAIFDGLFKLYGTHNGASLFNLFFLSMICVNFVGFIPYLTFKSKKPLKEMEAEFEQLNA